MSNYGLRLEGIRHVIDGMLVVDDVSLDVPAGEVMCLLGPSGCGKSTTLRIAAGLEELQQGSVNIEGEDVAGDGLDPVAPEIRGVGLVFQDYALFPHLSVLENVAFGLSELPEAAQKDRALTMLAKVGMEGYAYGYPHTLSGGEQQRVALARALAPQPRLMLMDEPFSGLDIRLRDKVRDEALELLKETGTSTLLVTHDPAEAMRMADRIAVMRNGRIVQTGTPWDIYGSPADAFVCSFFSEVNILRAFVKDDSVHTPVGDLPAGGLPDGAAAEVLIRPEALHVYEAGSGPAGGAEAVVAASRLMGSYCHATIRFGSGVTALDLHVHVAGPHPPEKGSRVKVRLDRAQAFVFPAEATSVELV